MGGVHCVAALTLPIVLMLAAGAAHAHGPDGAGAAHWWRWNLEPWLLALLAAAAAFYARGVWRLWSGAGMSRGISRGSACAFAAGWTVLVLALVSPLDALGSLLFSAHMVQHEILMVVAAPLLVLGRPLAAWTWAFGDAGRHRIGRIVRTRWLARPWALLTNPLAAWALHAVVLWAWHVPPWFAAAVEHEGVHVLQHATFLASALLFWWTTLGTDPRAARTSGRAMASLFTTMLHTAALGALLSLAPAPWYAPYVGSSAALGFDPLEDQQLGGLVMWVPAGMAYVIAALFLLARLLRTAPEQAPRGPLR